MRRSGRQKAVDQAVAKLGAKLIIGKAVSRPSFPIGVYIFIPPNINYIYNFYPTNINNPTLPYCPSIADLQAIDWAVIP